MKHMIAMVLAVVRLWSDAGIRPVRDIVLAFVADEEAGGRAGARYLVENRPDYFADCCAAIGEVGGFSVSLDDATRLYLIQTAEKGLHWMRLTALGDGGHGSLIHRDTPVARLAAAVARIADHQFPVVLDDSMRAFVQTVDDLTGSRFDPERLDDWLQQLGSISRMIEAALRQTANPTWISAGGSVNVIPAHAVAGIDARFLPGGEDELIERLRDLAGGTVTLETVLRADAISAPYATGLVESMIDAIKTEDPGAHTAPFMLSAGTDAKAFSQLGIPCYGFAPLRLPVGLDFASLFHARDERVPVDGLRFGVRVLHRFLSTC